MNVGVSKTRNAFPSPIVVGEPSKATECNGGFIPSIDKEGKACSVACQTCNGTGSKNLFTPFNTAYFLRGNSVLGDNTLPTNPIYWVDPPQGALESTRNEIRENRDIAFDYIGLKYSNTEVKGSETALGKMIDREKTYSTYKMYSQDVAMTMQWWYDNWTELMFPLEKEKEITVQTFNNFRTISVAEANQIFAELHKDGAPQYMQIDILKERYNAVGEIDKFKIVNKYYLYDNHNALMQDGSLGYYEKINIVISKNIMKWVDDEGVMEMNEAQMDTYFRDKAQSLMATPVPSLIV